MLANFTETYIKIPIYRCYACKILLEKKVWQQT